MALTSTTDELRKAVVEVRGSVLEIVEAQPGITIADVYSKLSDLSAQWREPALRSAIWELISEHKLMLRRGNTLELP
jgi:hypothetical protein